MIFRKKGYPENFIGKCFKKLLDNILLMDIQTVKFVQVIEYNKRTIFLQKSCRNWETVKLVSDRFLFFDKVLYEVKASGLQLSFNTFGQSFT